MAVITFLVLTLFISCLPEDGPDLDRRPKYVLYGLSLIVITEHNRTAAKSSGSRFYSGEEKEVAGVIQNYRPVADYVNGIVFPRDNLRGTVWGQDLASEFNVFLRKDNHGKKRIALSIVREEVATVVKTGNDKKPVLILVWTPAQFRRDTHIAPNHDLGKRLDFKGTLIQ